MLGVAFGITSTLFAVGFLPETIVQAAVVTAAGGVLGLAIGRRVSPMQLPQTVAALHSVVGLAAVMTSADSVLRSGAEHAGTLHLVTAYIGVLVGGVTFTGGSVVNCENARVHRPAGSILAFPEARGPDVVKADGSIRTSLDQLFPTRREHGYEGRFRHHGTLFACHCCWLPSG